MFGLMTVLRVTLLALATCVMTLTGIGAAMARGQMAADGVICGTGTYSVVLAADGLPLFDEGGSPVETQALPCLDCIFVAAALATAPATPARNDGTATSLVAHPSATFSARLWRMGGMGRSPPDAA